MDGGDMMEVEVYKERGKALKEGGGEKGEKKRRKEKEEHWEKRVNNTTFYVNLVSLGELVESLILTYLLTPTLFFPALVLGQNPLLLFVSPSYKFYWFGRRLNCTTHNSKWAWATKFSGPYSYCRNKRCISFFFFF